VLTSRIKQHNQSAESWHHNGYGIHTPANYHAQNQLLSLSTRHAFSLYASIHIITKDALIPSAQAYATLLNLQGK
jgi:hypothetical protein